MSKVVRKPGITVSGKRTLHQVRIIGGQWKRTPLPVPDVDGLRPTPDRVRETVFNWISHLIDGDWAHVCCLDLFAGSGALGFEAASRGASRVVMAENHGLAAHQLETTRNKLNAVQVDIRRGDALALLLGLIGGKDHVRPAQPEERFNLIFADPPYHQTWLEKIMPLCEQLLDANGLMYVEAEYALDSEQAERWMQGWELVRSDKAGMVFYHLLQRKKQA